MVTSNKTLDNKAVTMSIENVESNAPPRTLLGEVNAHLTCVLCRGYYIDASTIVECLHSFCRSCIVKHLQVKSYCPVCEMMINSAKPNIKPDKALQDIVYKLVPGLFQREMERRQQFYSSRPGPAASATPEQRGEDTERIIFSPEDVISFSLEYVDTSETESVSSKSSESGNEIAPNTPAGAATRRYLQCPAVVNVSHLKKFLCMKFDIDQSQYSIDILYKRVSLSDYYTLMDIAYIYNWKRNEPMRFFYQITDSTAIKSRYALDDVDRKGLHFRRDRKPSLANTEGTNVSSPLQHLHDSDVSSGANSPMPEEVPSILKLDLAKLNAESKKYEKTLCINRIEILKTCMDENSDSNFSESSKADSETTSQQCPEVDAEKSHFLNSFELTARSSTGSSKSVSPIKCESVAAADVNSVPETSRIKSESTSSPTTSPSAPAKAEDAMKRKINPTIESVKPVDSKKAKSSDVKVMLTEIVPKLSAPPASTASALKLELPSPTVEAKVKSITSTSNTKSVASPIQQVATLIKSDIKHTKSQPHMIPQKITPKIETPPPPLHSIKRPVPASFKVSPPKRKGVEESPNNPLKCPPFVKTQNKQNISKTIEANKPTKKKLPELTLKMPLQNRMAHTKQPIRLTHSHQDRGQAGSVEDLNSEKPLSLPATHPAATSHSGLAKSNPSQVKTPTTTQTATSQPSQTKPLISQAGAASSGGGGDPLKSLFDSCKIPSSLSITLTEQKLDSRPPNENPSNGDTKKSAFGKNASLNGSSNSFFPMKTPSPPVHNYIEILKLPDMDSSKKTNRSESSTSKQSTGKSSDAPSGKGPVPNLNPISDVKSKSQSSFTKPQTFQQTFLQSLQQLSDKPKFGKKKYQLPKLNSVPGANLSPVEGKDGAPPTTPPATLDVKSKLPATPATAQPEKDKTITPMKTDSVLDLSTPHPTQSQLGPQQAKSLQTMQSIANLAKKHSYSQKLASTLNASQGLQSFSQSNISKTAGQSSPHLRIPMPSMQNKPLKAGSPLLGSASSSPRPDHFQSLKSSNNRASLNPVPPLSLKSGIGTGPSQGAQGSTNFAQPSPRNQTRSPSSSPKLVIACPSPKSQSPDEKRSNSPNASEANANQSNQISSSQMTSSNVANASDNLKNVSGGGSSSPKNIKPQLKPPPSGKSSQKLPSSVPKPGPSGVGGGSTYPPPELPMHPQLLQQAFLRQQLELQSMGILPGAAAAAAHWFNNTVVRAQLENLVKNISEQPNQSDFPNQHKDNK